MRIIIAIPAYNESKKIYNIVQSVRERGYSVVVVDDGSIDTTADEAQSAGARVLRHCVNRGYGAALTTGNTWALRNGYDIVVHFDADGQHNPDEIKDFIEPIFLGHADVLLGSRFLRSPHLSPLPKGGPRKGVPFFRKILIKLAVLFTWVFSGIKLTDAHNGFRAFSRRALTYIDCRQDGMAYSSEIIDQVAEHRLGWKEVPVTLVYTDYSQAKGESNIKKISLGIQFLWGKIIK